MQQKGAFKMVRASQERNGLSAVSHSGITPVLSEILGAVRLDLAHVEKDDASSPSTAEILQSIKNAEERLGYRLTAGERDSILAEIEREKLPFGILEELVNDADVSDIIVLSYQHIEVQRNRKNIKTAASFPSQQDYEAYVEKLLHKANVAYSNKQPLADGMLGENARIHVVHKCIAAKGPFLTIRLNRFSSVTIETLINKGLAPSPVLRYLQALVLQGKTGLVIGEVGTGKTTLARALAGSVPEDETVLVIEDTPELRLDHSSVRYITTRSANVEGEGKVSPAEVIRGGMRMAMNRIIYGEIREAEAAEAFIDVCASGHPGLSTLHAKTPDDAIVRLGLFLSRAQKNVNQATVDKQIATAVAFIASVDVCPITHRRRLMEVREIGAVSDGAIKRNTLFRYRVIDGIPAWERVGTTSLYEKELLSCKEPFSLSSLPKSLELDDAIMLREATEQAYS